MGHGSSRHKEAQNAHKSKTICAFRAFLWLNVELFFAVGVGPLDAKLLQTILKSAESEA